MRVALVAYPFLDIPPVGYGGVERVLYNLSSAFRQRDVSFTLFKPGGTLEGVDCVSYLDQPLVEKYEHFSIDDYHAELEGIIDNIVVGLVGGDYDIINTHFEDAALVRRLLKLNAPVLVTIHTLPYLTESFAELTSTRHERLHFSGVSPGHVEQLKAAGGPDTIFTTLNGIDVRSFDASCERRRFMLYIGDLLPRKAVLSACRAVRSAGASLIVAGKAMPGSDRDYVERLQQEFFDITVVPDDLDATIKRVCSSDVDEYTGKIVHVGEVNEGQKRLLLSHAAALLFPSGMEDSRWVEPFGLVVAEALASGTPVASFNRGHFADILQSASVACLFEDQSGFVDSIMRLQRFDDHAACRRFAEEHLTLENMAQDYLKVYDQILAGQRSGRHK
ncbi:MAG: glycosyltransferase [candidate division Zixibacteria bacterium]|nr:glycosyltransferase [candidate division Zixibacteria bacterium]MDH3936095.1 glycosyltransferase [candidate division Zixibacteria bacterium]